MIIFDNIMIIFDNSLIIFDNIMIIFDNIMIIFVEDHRREENPGNLKSKLPLITKQIDCSEISF